MEDNVTEELNIKGNLDLARHRAEKAHQILVKFKQCHLSEDYDLQLSQFCTSLSDILFAHENLNHYIDYFFKSDTSNSLEIADLITDMIVELDHLNWHTNHVLSEAKDIAQYFYSK
tara:strand:- start:138 stop:485 length:348 start_codon:yes stop_codon:yes gene_type:complete